MTAFFPNIPDQSQRVTSHQPAVRQGIYGRRVKRLLDTAIILLTAPITFPVILVMAFFVALDGHNPIYKQKRVGRGGRTFSMFKLRTMVPNADKMLAQYLAENPEAKAEWDSAQKLKNDPRVTAVGRILRKTSLDELPQLWNVLLGHMSLVGPRPMLLEQRSIYPGTSYYCVRPGITGPWQVSARNTCEFKGRAKYDAFYASNVSFKMDLAIIFRTVTTVLRGTGY